MSMSNVILTEIKLRSTDWANVSGYYFNRDGVSISRGRGATEAQAGPSECNLTLDNTGGWASLRNPNSLVYGQIGRNTPIRISIGRGAYGMVLDGIDGNGGGAFTADKAQLDITGDIDVRVDLETLARNANADVLSDWTSGSFDLASKLNDNDSARSWSLIVVSGKLRFYWSTAGTAASVKSAESTVTLPGPAQGRKAIRVTLDVDNGAAGNTVTFYTAPTITGPWTQLGATVVQAGVTSIFAGNAPLRIGGALNGSAYAWGEGPRASFYSAYVANGINGTAVANPVFTTQPLDPAPFGSATFNDGFGNSWSYEGLADAARIWYGDVDIRFVGELAELPPRWDPSHSNKYVPVTANGILRRLNQGKSPAATGLRDFILRSDNIGALAAYYPLSGGEGTTYSLSLAPLHLYLQGRFRGLADNGGVPVFAYGQDMGASWIGTGLQINATGSAYMMGDVATPDQNAAFDFVWRSDSLGVLTVEVMDNDLTNWQLILDTSTDAGTLQVKWADTQSTLAASFPVAGPFGELSDTGLHHCRFALSTVGSDTTFTVYIDGISRSVGTLVGKILNGVSVFRLYYTRYTGQTYVYVAHLAMWANASAAAIPAISDAVLAAFGYSGETAADRITRVCDDGGIPVRIVGAAASSSVMGVQFAETRLAQIRDAESTDLGILTEQRDDNGLLYRTRASLYAQTGTTFDYSAKLIAPPFEPVDDDQLTHNDVTATRRDGGSFELALTTGTMSSLDPPAGIGKYEDEITVNVQSDAQLVGAASWWLKLGTLDAARFPAVTFNLAASTITPTIRDQILALDVGDRIIITNVTAADIPDQIDLIIQGYSETFDNATWTITFNCAPGAPYQVAKYSGTARYDADGSQLTSAVTSTATSFQVSQTGTSIWSTTTTFPFDIYVGGERMTVTAISGATSPQTFTVTRSVNGVVKAQTAGTPVKLWVTPRYAY